MPDKRFILGIRKFDWLPLVSSWVGTVYGNFVRLREQILFSFIIQRCFDGIPPELDSYLYW